MTLSILTVRSALALLVAGGLFQACLQENTSVAREPGVAHVRVQTSVPAIASLAKGQTISLRRLVLEFTSNATSPDTVRDTITAFTTPSLNTSPSADQTVSKTYTLKGLRTWKVVASVYDARDSLIHRDSATTPTFLKVADTATVALNLKARYTMYEARFASLPDSVTSMTGPNKQQIRITRLVLKINGEIVRDSSASPYFTALTQHVLGYDYVRQAAEAAEPGVPPLGFVNDLHAIDFPNADTGYISGSPGNYRSTDGGMSWFTYTGANHNGATEYKYVSFSTGGKGVWAGDSAYLISVNNGVFQDPAKFTNFTHKAGPVAMVNDTGFSIQNSSTPSGSTTYRRTINGGVTWAISAGYAANIYGLQCLKDYTCWAVGYRGLIRKNTGVSGGFLSVQRDSLPSQANLLDVHFVDSNYGWVVGNSGTILATTNGGGTWTVQGSGTGNNLNGVHFLDRSNGYIVGDNGTLLSTANGGATWTPRASGTPNHLYGLSFAGSVGYAVGMNSTIIRLGGVQTVEMLVYGTLPGWNSANPLFRGARYIAPIAGADDSASLSLTWMGPTTGTEALSVTLGRVGKTIVNGGFNGQVPKRAAR